METVLKRLSVFINIEGGLLFSKGVHWKAKKSLKIFASSTILVTAVIASYKKWRYRKNLKLNQKVIENGPIDFWTCVGLSLTLYFAMS